MAVLPPLMHRAGAAGVPGAVRGVPPERGIPPGGTHVPPRQQQPTQGALAGLQAWSTFDQKLEAEEVMKVINELKPANL